MILFRFKVSLRARLDLLYLLKVSVRWNLHQLHLLLLSLRHKRLFDVFCTALIHGYRHYLRIKTKHYC